MKTDDKPIIHFPHREAWAKWLVQNHQQSSGLWLRLAKKAAGIASVSYAEALEEALCHGWIDGQKQSDNEHFWLQKFTPRGPRSLWSKVNRDKALALIASGAMHPAGLQEVERARADGRWEAAYDSARTATVPEDFALALAAHPEAQAFFATLTSSQRYAMLFRLQTARKPETRTRRIAEFTAMLARGEAIRLI